MDTVKQTSNTHSPKHDHGAHEEPYHILINGKEFKVDESVITGRDIAIIAGKTPPENYSVFQRKHGQKEPVPVAPNAEVDLREPGTEQFLVLPRVQSDGSPSLRRDFVLPEADTQTLEELGLPWETVVEKGVCRLVIYKFPVDPGYNMTVVDVFIRIEAGYPDTPLDMAYFHPPLQRKNGKAIHSTSPEAFDGRTWQRWSRHRRNEDAWIPGVDGLDSHIACIRLWLKHEVA